MKYNKEQMAADIKSVKRIPANEDQMIDETLEIELRTLNRIETFYLTKKEFYLKNVLFPAFFNKKQITWNWLLSFVK